MWTSLSITKISLKTTLPKELTSQLQSTAVTKPHICMALLVNKLRWSILLKDATSKTEPLKNISPVKYPLDRKRARHKWVNDLFSCCLLLRLRIFTKNRRSWRTLTSKALGLWEGKLTFVQTLRSSQGQLFRNSSKSRRIEKHNLLTSKESVIKWRC